MTVGDILAPAVGPLTACRTFLTAELAARGITDLPVGVSPPPGTPTRYVLLARSGSNQRSFITCDYLIRARVFDEDSVRCEHDADLICQMLMYARHRKIHTAGGDVWVSGTHHQFGPAAALAVSNTELDDANVRLFVYQIAVFWTIGLKPA